MTRQQSLADRLKFPATEVCSQIKLTSVLCSYEMYELFALKIVYQAAKHQLLYDKLLVLWYSLLQVPVWYYIRYVRLRPCLG